MTRIAEDAKAFIRTWQDVGKLLDAATHEERLLILRHYVEVVELHSTDPKGRSGTYALRLFPEVRPDRGFDLGDDEPLGGPDDSSPCPEMTSSDDSQAGDAAAVLTDSRLVRVIDQKAPRKEPSSFQYSLLRSLQLSVRPAVTEFVTFSVGNIRRSRLRTAEPVCHVEMLTRLVKCGRRDRSFPC